MKLSLRWGGGATWILRTCGLTIACDPVLCPAGTVQDYGVFRSTRLEPPALPPEAFAAVDLWLLTHGHEDHLDAAGLRVIGPRATVFCDGSARRRLSGRAATTLRWGEPAAFTSGAAAAHVEAVPAIHAQRAVLGRLVGNGNGYLVAIRQGCEEARVYATGDAVLGPELRAALQRFRPHVVIANAGGARVGAGLLGKALGRITMSGADLATLARAAAGATVVPVHHGTFAHYADRSPPTGPGLSLLRPGEELTVDVPAAP